MLTFTNASTPPAESIKIGRPFCIYGLESVPLSLSLRLADILKRDVVLVPAATPLRDAACLLHERQAQAVLVVRDGRVVALLTARELLPGLLPDGSVDAPAARSGRAVGVLDVASAPLCIAAQDGRVESVFAPMRQAGASLVVVVDAAGTPLGVVGSCELLRACLEARGVTEAVSLWSPPAVGAAVQSDEPDRTELLRQAQERWKYAIEATDRGVWDWRVGTEHIYFSPKWQALLGYAEGELPDRLESWMSRVHPEDLPTLQAELARHLAGGSELCSCDHRVRRKDGRYTWLLARGKVIQSGRDGQPRRMIGTCTDITERRHMEDELRRTVDKLAQREAALSQAQSLARFGSWMFDLARSRFSGSDEALRLSGWRRGQHYGFDELLSMVHTNDRRRLRQAWSGLCRGQQHELKLELRFTVDGVLRWVE
ncbi:MAG: PAS domain-containing protein, partial [Leptothrix sp. (in: b-proteobacteria)]